MSQPSIIVTGANGQLGKELRDLADAYPQFDFIFLSREELSIHDREKVKGYFEKVRPAFCINCAAYTGVDKAETDKELAMLVNGDAVGILALVCKSFDTKFVHVSTDYVFDGTSTTPYREDDKTIAVNYYGTTKLKGEELAVENNKSSIIIRTSWVYSVYGNNFVKTMLRLMKERETLNVVNDQLGSPTYAADLAQAIMHIIVKTQAEAAAWIPGIYHYSNEGVTSWFDFAVAIKEFSGSKCIIHPIPTAAYPTPAKRPAYSAFDKTKIKQVYQLTIGDWKSRLAVAVKNLS